MEHAGAGRMLVAGLGLREGLILEALNAKLPRPAEVSENAIRSLVSRFASWDERRATRRKTIAEKLSAVLLRSGSAFQREMTSLAATILDIGRSVEYYRRHEHAAMILRSAGLDGFSHREILYLSLIIKIAGSPDWRGRDYRPLLRNGDLEEIARAAVILSLADEMEHRVPPGRAPRLRCRVAGSSVLVSEPALAAWEPAGLAEQFRSNFGKTLRVSG
jgi:exopolyphosphatase/guanosine-5'-triphosphate,3'-diphosphate pyrophosphatase